MLEGVLAAVSSSSSSSYVLGRENLHKVGDGAWSQPKVVDSVVNGVGLGEQVGLGGGVYGFELVEVEGGEEHLAGDGGSCGGVDLLGEGGG